MIACHHLNVGAVVMLGAPYAHSFIQIVTTLSLTNNSNGSTPYAHPTFPAWNLVIHFLFIADEAFYQAKD